MLTYFIVILLTMVLFSFYVVNSIKSYLFNDQKVGITTTANTIASFADDYMRDDNMSMDIGFVKFLLSMKMDEKMRVNVVNKDSVVIFDSQKNSALLGKAQLKETVITALSGHESSSVYKNSDGYDIIDVSVPIMNGQSIFGAINITYQAEKISSYVNDITKDIIMLFIVIFFLVGIIIFIIANFMTRRIVNFTNKITEMSDGILDEKIEVKGHDEVARMGEAFNNMSEKLALLEHTRVQFVSDASHELKTPLSSIKLMADSIIQTPDISIDQVREFLTDMVGEVDRLNRIVNKLLYITKMDSMTEQDMKRFELINLRDMVSDIVKTLSPLAASEGIDFNLESGEDIYVMADIDRLWQGIYNIADNAIKYTKEYGFVNVSLTKEGTNAIISVKDNGVGITEEERQKIFDRFYRVDKARTRDTGGTGLGLAIALAAVRIHGGDIQVESEPNIGSEFKIILPIAESSVQENEPDSVENKA